MGSQRDFCLILEEASTLHGDIKSWSPALGCSLGILVLLITLNKRVVTTHDILGKLVVQVNSISFYPFMIVKRNIPLTSSEKLLLGELKVRMEPGLLLGPLVEEGSEPPYQAVAKTILRINDPVTWVQRRSHETSIRTAVEKSFRFGNSATNDCQG
jgi:hypothetical protein